MFNIDKTIIILLFMLLFGFVRPLILKEKLDSKIFIYMTLLLMIWYYSFSFVISMIHPKPEKLINKF